MKAIPFREIDGRSPGYYLLLGVLGLLVVIGAACAFTMEHNGHHITGMTNQVIWGVPHVFAVFLIIAASGILNVASIASVFGRAMYKPLARLSALLAFCVLTGGLIVLVLDLGRPDRLIVAMTYYNFKSIFAWNIFLYTGFFAIVIVYLWMMIERRMNAYAKPVGVFAFVWRLILTTGTGSIFGFLVAREAYDTSLLAPLFIVMSFSFGLAIFLLVLFAAYGWTGRALGDAVVARLKNLLAVFVAAVLYFILVYHLTNLYMTEKHGVEKFLLVDGGIYTALFWIGFIGIGSLAPLAIFFTRLSRSRAMVALGALLVIAGGIMQIYVIIIGGQSYPISMFPGKTVTSSFFDGTFATYTPTPYEFGLGIGGVALALTMAVVAIRVLPFLPLSLGDDVADPHHGRSSTSEPAGT